MESFHHAIVIKIKDAKDEIVDEMHLMEKRFESKLEKSMERTKQDIQSMESKLHNMLRMELDNTISFLVQ
jgi:chaperonin cofactor prefoldin